MSPLLKQKHFHIPIPWRHQCLVYAYTYPKEKANKKLSIFLSTTSILPHAVAFRLQMYDKNLLST